MSPRGRPFLPLSNKSPAALAIRRVLKLTGYSQFDLADRIGISHATIGFLVNGKRRLSPQLALRLARAVTGTTPEFWLDLQNQQDLAEARRQIDFEAIEVALTVNRPEDLLA